MNLTKMEQRFPRSRKYNPAWVAKNGFGGHPLWQTEWLCEALDLQAGMRILDLGCGRAVSSIFLAREFDVEVWATDLWIAASENLQRIRDAGLERQVYPLHADAKALPFAGEFFDAVVAVDCYSYFGTDSLYLNYLAHFVKPGGKLGIAGAGLVHELTDGVPEHLREFWSQDFWALHSLDWWRQLWERTGIVSIRTADTLSEGWRYWSAWQRVCWPDNLAESEAVDADAGRTFTYVRLVGERNAGVKLEDYAWPDNLRSFPAAYEALPMLREDVS